MRYAYVNARLHALIGSLLTEDFFVRVERAPTLEESIYFFQNTSYGFIQTTYARTGDLKSVEKELLCHLYNEIEHIKKHAPDVLKELIAILSARIRYDAFKTLLRLWYDQSFRKRSIADFAEYIPRDIPLESLHHDAIINAPDTDALIELLRHTAYAPAIPGLERLHESKTLVESELALEKDYYMRVVGVVITFHGDERMRVERLIAGEIDEVNLGRMMRMAPFFSDQQRIMDLFIDGGRRITAADYGAYAKAADKAAFFDTLLGRFGIIAPLGKMEKSTEYTRVLSRVAATLDEEKIQLYRKTKITSLFDAGLTVAYVRLLEREIRRIIHLLNAHNYGKVKAGGLQ